MFYASSPTASGCTAHIVRPAIFFLQSHPSFRNTITPYAHFSLVLCPFSSGTWVSDRHYSVSLFDLRGVSSWNIRSQLMILLIISIIMWEEPQITPAVVMFGSSSLTKPNSLVFFASEDEHIYIYIYALIYTWKKKGKEKKTMTKKCVCDSYGWLSSSIYI